MSFTSMPRKATVYVVIVKLSDSFRRGKITYIVLVYYIYVKVMVIRLYAFYKLVEVRKNVDN